MTQTPEDGSEAQESIEQTEGAERTGRVLQFLRSRLHKASKAATGRPGGGEKLTPAQADNLFAEYPEFAETGISRDTVKSWRARKQSVSIDHAVRIARAFSVSTDWLVFGGRRGVDAEFNAYDPVRAAIESALVYAGEAPDSARRRMSGGGAERWIKAAAEREYTERLILRRRVQRSVAAAALEYARRNRGDLPASTFEAVAKLCRSFERERSGQLPLAQAGFDVLVLVLSATRWRRTLGLKEPEDRYEGVDGLTTIGKWRDDYDGWQLLERLEVRFSGSKSIDSKLLASWQKDAEDRNLGTEDAAKAAGVFVFFNATLAGRWDDDSPPESQSENEVHDR